MKYVSQFTAERLLCVALLALATMGSSGVSHASTAVRSSPCQVVSTIDSKLTQRIAATRGGPIAYYRFGRGKPLMLITGYRATVSEWNSAFLDALAANHDVIVFDNPGVGRSRSDALPETMEGMADAASELITALHLPKVDVIGWSMGGMVAQQLAIDHAHQVGSLVLLSTTAPGADALPVPGAVTSVLSGQSPSPFETIMAALFPPNAQAQAVRCFRGEMFTPADYGHVSVDARTAKAQEQAMAAWWKDNAAAKALSRVAVPTLIVTGEQDTVVAVENARVLNTLLPNAMLHTVADGGHALMYQDPKGLASELSRFIDKTSQPSRQAMGAGAP
jgi:pimeloyl-ACP methyl ester carboxylesterase